MFLKHDISRRRLLQQAVAIAAAGWYGGRPVWGAEGDLIVRTAEPLNAEPPLSVLLSQHITAVKHFYVRNHGALPKLDAGALKVRVEGMVEQPLDLSLAELRERFREVSTEATLTCAGNRRQEMSAIKPVAGVQWGAGAIGHARWTGAMLADVLRAAKVQGGAKHVWFEGLDPVKEKDGSVAPFGGSIPVEKALASNGQALLAHTMNEQPLTLQHGFPLRTIIPGYIGARSVKWLSKITVSDRPSPNHYVADAYKLIQSEAKDEAAAKSPIYEFSVNAAICSPAAGAQIKAGRTLVGGYALPSGDVACTVAKVEVSGDGGKSWTSANFVDEARMYAWRQWTAEIGLPVGKHELVVRATDSRGNSMPETAEWNLKGYLYNGWHRVRVEAV
jgi:sulfite oxidase